MSKKYNNVVQNNFEITIFKIRSEILTHLIRTRHLNLMRSIQKEMSLVIINKPPSMVEMSHFKMSHVTCSKRKMVRNSKSTFRYSMPMNQSQSLVNIRRYPRLSNRVTTNHGTAVKTKIKKFRMQKTTQYFVKRLDFHRPSKLLCQTRHRFVKATGS
jgi:hypothetical protein